MNSKSVAVHALILLAMLSPGLSLAVDAKANMGPQAGGRTYAQNYKDMVFAHCIAKAYQKDSATSADAGSSVSALRDWTYFDLEKASKPMLELIDKFLARDYSNPLAESEVKGIKFDLLKCLDLYHSKELAEQTKRFVDKPNRSFQQDFPPAKR